MQFFSLISLYCPNLTMSASNGTSNICCKVIFFVTLRWIGYIWTNGISRNIVNHVCKERRQSNLVKEIRSNNFE